MKTRKQIIKKWEEEGYFLGTLQDAKNTFIINDGDDKYYENILSFKTNKDDIYVSFSEDVCPRYEGDFESVDFDEYKKYIKTKKWKTISKEVKERANNKCEICGSEKKLVTHHHNYINVYNEMHDDLLHHPTNKYTEENDRSRELCERFVDANGLKHLLGVFFDE